MDMFFVGISFSVLNAIMWKITRNPLSMFASGFCLGGAIASLIMFFGGAS